jgi:MFS family permease
MAFRQLCGLNAVLAYTVKIYETAGSAWDPYKNTAIFGAVQFVSTVIAVFIVDRVGRRILLIVSGGGVVLSLVIFVIHFRLLDLGIEIQYISWLPVIAVNLYIATFAVGLGPVPWFMMPELLSKEARSWVSSLAVCFNFTAAFIVTRYFLVMMNVWGSEATYGTLLVICLVGTVFVVVFVPETKKKTREEINTQLSYHWTFVTGWHELEE